MSNSRRDAQEASLWRESAERSVSNDLISVSAAARRLKVGEEKVLEAIARKVLSSVESNNRTWVRISEVERVRRDRLREQHEHRTRLSNDIASRPAVIGFKRACRPRAFPPVPR